jgi:protein TonB
MRVVKSSGNDALDDAAKRIVAMSAPFAALPDELLKEASVLVITRVWRFSDESGFSAR